MRLILLKFFAFSLLLLVFSSLQAQTTKIGYVNLKTIYTKLPDVATAEKEADDLSKKNNLDLDQQKKNLDQQWDAFYKQQSGDTTKTKGKMTAKQKEDLVTEDQAFRQLVQTKHQAGMKLREEKYALIETKIKAAIQAVASEKGYSGIMDTGTVVYYSLTDDITPLVLAKLGVK